MNDDLIIGKHRFGRVPSHLEEECAQLALVADELGIQIKDITLAELAEPTFDVDGSGGE
jgi:hypothetical protein